MPKINGNEINNLDSWEVEIDPARTSVEQAQDNFFIAGINDAGFAGEIFKAV